MHDVEISFYLENFLEDKMIMMSNLITVTKVNLSKDYIEKYWVGLFEGDGSMVIRRNKQDKIYASFEIGLKYLSQNVFMLNIIAEKIGGRIYYEKKNKEIITVKWIALSKKDVHNCLNILNKYPLLTTRKLCQFEHLKNCYENKEWSFHLKTRDNRYDLMLSLNLINRDKNPYLIPPYFNEWLSGFIEAEGSFRSINNKASSFYISQNDDYYILNVIKAFFNSHHKLGIHKDLRYEKIQYRISMSGKPCLTLIKNHLTNYPLIGNKLLSFNIWKDSI